ncbi:hypothetical protein GALL_532440 [mine drainage metagenome]|uniref:Uncharacterized protein n=1 Tax=mine drainage metagenome TaxID=410659 RepID=A0A1J5PBM8_9ZZZZ
MIRFADRDKNQIMLGQFRRKRQIRCHIKQIEQDIGAFQQNFYRRIRHQVTWRYQRQHAQAGLFTTEGQLIDLLQLERLRLHLQSQLAILFELQNHRQIHQHIGRLRMRIGIGNQIGCQWRKIVPAQGHPH